MFTTSTIKPKVYLHHPYKSVKDQHIAFYETHLPDLNHDLMMASIFLKQPLSKGYTFDGTSKYLRSLKLSCYSFRQNQ